MMRVLNKSAMCCRIGPPASLVLMITRRAVAVGVHAASYRGVTGSEGASAPFFIHCGVAS